MNVIGHLVFEALGTSGFAWLRQQLQARQQGATSLGALPAPCIEKLPAESLDLLYLAWQAAVRHRRWCPAAPAITHYIDSEQHPTRRAASSSPPSATLWVCRRL